MGHRALVAYRRSDGSYSLHYAHWGRGLGARITADRPFGGPALDVDLGNVADRVAVEPRTDFRPPTRVEPRPVAAGVAPAGVLAALDAAYETLVVVSPTYETTTYLVCSLDPTGEGGDLRLVRPEGGREEFRGWFVETKSALSAAVADGSLSREAARTALRRAVADRATVHPADDASFLRDR